MVANPSAGLATIELHTGRSQTPDGFPLERRLDNSGSHQVKNASVWPKTKGAQREGVNSAHSGRGKLLLVARAARSSREFDTSMLAVRVDHLPIFDFGPASFLAWGYSVFRPLEARRPTFRRSA